MKIAIGADTDGFELKEHLKNYLKSKGIEVIDKTPEKGINLVKSASLVAQAVMNKEADRAVAIDEYGAGSFMVGAKHKGIICAEVSDEHSAKMTSQHNSANMLAIGAGIVGKRLAEGMLDAYIAEKYAGGRHQIRVDMLNKML
ncbi:galactose-6-phosphate isomerase [Clostridium acetobutylicum]|uniref:Galactose-6-phosphate isomerase subunit LacA n=1 Tax=Clostridium acetobutylicum (strain ATCC 824 / DSM 792 / JCM 1419 / IAM 19013 / LMG 5710 / NBRC 13948 / NRRL B-527 / VKM B-1787 / 2291 / W) TaxID=272562 RepID=LACA_CLOAB|nr:MULTISPECIES: galactose-6-phosphate isomerase subunit LacA [Clostridium]Q97F01.1 RecName: Full=Galactose-6-phosphate isomerase subunit LacA [Clostridium acetobutylicum ATCC 824]AAK80896.1 Galactose-6-phosphate isomerase [Clostridium acetobutylicum ATCC 824]ADZ21998.1 galactose-6-phosphate isomerase subunit LacA [Clostridium acetobutylicum EA 2018]AEI34736.1 galactose-6-phosphate isomerase subunit LacA [Clostridium acetobutylicum DSM 1731]AWV78692.1 galactose-6-phosphate isomerase subunit La